MRVSGNDGALSGPLSTCGAMRFTPTLTSQVPADCACAAGAARASARAPGTRMRWTFIGIPSGGRSRSQPAAAGHLGGDVAGEQVVAVGRGVHAVGIEPVRGVLARDEVGGGAGQ